MTQPPPRCLRLLGVVVCAIGCGEGAIQFERNRLLHATNRLTSEQSASVDAMLAAWFGTPDEPRLPDGMPHLAGLIELPELEQAAGPVISHTPGVTQGLYRRHCARCHGVTGDGRGPTARYQAPYPRDFRRGVFKWKSTYRDAKPTADDLHATLERGVPGTAMPSFALLTEEERETLRQYVVYLAVRGEAERGLVEFVADELPPEETPAAGGDLEGELIAEVLAPIVADWLDAERQVVAASDAMPGDPAAGRELYHSERAGCAKCHGDDGRGGAVAGVDFEIDFDVWNRTRVVEAPTPDVAQLLANDLPPRMAMPRELIGSTPHGGSSPADLFRRLHQGVAGSTMPALGGVGPDESGALTDQEVWDLVAYTQTLLADEP